MIRLVTTGRSLVADLEQSIAEVQRRRVHAELDAMLDVRGIDTPIPYALNEPKEETCDTGSK